MPPNDPKFPKKDNYRDGDWNIEFNNNGRAKRLAKKKWEHKIQNDVHNRKGDGASAALDFYRGAIDKEAYGRLNKYIQKTNRGQK